MNNESYCHYPTACDHSIPIVALRYSNVKILVTFREKPIERDIDTFKK